MKAVNLCPNINLNISFESNYFEIEENNLKDYSSFVCFYNYNSPSGFVDSGSFNIKHNIEITSDVIYDNNSELEIIGIVCSIIIIFALIIGLFYVFKFVKNKYYK